MDPLNEYIFNFKKTHLIFDFDKTLFKIIIDWDKYFDNIENELIHYDKKLFNNYQNGLVSWCDMQNLYIDRYGPEMRKMICINNIQSENSLITDAIPNISLLNLIKSNDKLFLSIWSSNTKISIQNILRKYHILDKFDKIICRDDLKYLKPNPEGFSKIYQPKTTLDKYLFIGDSINDSNAALNCKIDFYKISYFV
jgi:HAD superfamily hydrolase (TIGR01549 family)